MPQAFAEQLGSIPMSPNLGQSLERAHRFAREQSHKAVTLEHLLLALTEDSEAALILQSANVDLARLGTDVSGYLGRLLEDMRGDGKTEPRPDGDLLRVIQAAGSAAKQSRRRQIDGAIVLAAIVGDGKSPAAGLLKALGMTFEEAIRALQRANTKARLSPAPKPTASTPAPAAAPAPDAVPAAEPTAPATAAGVSQTAEDILAAARARIQQRAAAPGKQAPAPSREDVARSAPSRPDPPPEPEDNAQPVQPLEPADTAALTEAIEAAMSGTVTRTAEPAPAPLTPPEPPARMPPPATPSTQPVQPRAQHQAQPAWTPPPEPRPQAAPRMPPPPPARSPMPFPARPAAANEGPRRPPLPSQPASAAQPQAGFPNRPRRAPWPELGEQGAGMRPAAPNGALAGTAHAALDRTNARPAPAPAPWSPASARGGQTDKGLLIESVPRRMRVGVPASAEVRIARDRVDALIQALNGRGGSPLPDHSLTRALSVRLRAPGTHFWIEPAAPETQWVESGSSIIQDDQAIWRWTVVPRRRGRGRLTLMVSARTLGRDGIMAELAPPDRVIEVKVGANYGRAIGRWLRLLLAMLVGALAGYFHEQAWTTARLFIDRALGG